MTKGSVRLTIPNPHRGDIDVALLKRILRIANIDEAVWNSLRPLRFLNMAAQYNTLRTHRHLLQQGIARMVVD